MAGTFPLFRRNGATRARAVLDHQGLSPPFGDALADDARVDVGNPAYGEGADDADRFRGVGLSACRPGDAKRNAKRREPT